MDGKVRMRWRRIAAAVVAAEALPIVVLILIVMVYGFTRGPGSLPPEQFAPAAGKWVGPLGGILATLLLARWASRRSPNPVAQGAAVGAGTALLDFGLAILLGGGGPVEPLLYLSNAGRLLAGFLGGWLVSCSGGSREPGSA